MGQLHNRMKADLTLAGYSPSTSQIYLIYARKFAKHFMRSPSLMGDEEVRSFLLYLLQEKGVSYATYRQYRAALQFLYRVTLQRPQEIAHVPCRRKSSPLPVVLSLEEVSSFLKRLREFKYRAIAMTIYASGLRISEACRLQPKDIDSSRRLIHVRNGKGRKDRYTVLSKRLLSFPRDYYRKSRPSVWLFPAAFKGNARLSPNTVRLAFRQAGKEAGLSKRVTPHILRHCFATHLLESGVDITFISALLGHKSIRTTEIYTHVSSEQIAKVKSPLDLLPASATRFKSRG
jgi:site-specific recombinase XerD